MKIGIVIQGPIISVGRNFQSAKFINFDSTRNIEKLYQAGSDLGCEVVLTTWEGEDASSVRIPEADVFKYEATSKELSSNIFNYRNSSKYKQFFLVRKGVEILKSRHCEVIVKVRTDQYLDLSALIDFLRGNSLEFNRKIISLFADIRIPDSWVDFAFASKTDYIEEVLTEYVSAKEIFSNVHRDFFYHIGGQDFYRMQRIWYKLTIPYHSRNFTKSQLVRVHQIWSDYFLLMPIEILKSLEWRGSLFNESNIPKGFYGLEDFDQFKLKLRNQYISAPTFSFNFISLEVLTLFFPGHWSDNIQRVFNSLRRRIRISKR